MPAIESFNAALESRNGPLAGTQAIDTMDLGAGTSDAFVAALLAQGMLPQAAPEATPVVPDTAVAGTVGQELPGQRPALAVALPSRRVLSAALPGVADAAAAPLAVGSDEEGGHDFAMAFAALQDAMVGGGGGDAEGAPAPAVGADNPLASADLEVLGDALAALGGAGPARSGMPGQAAESLLAAQVGAHHAPAAGNAGGQVYAARTAPLPMEQPALFAERLTQHVSVMLGDALQSATIAVTPPDLGPVEVRVTMVGDEARIQLAAAHQATREALHDALPKLRAALADSGLSLGQAGVFTHMPERQQQSPADTAQFAAREDGEFDAAALAPASAPRSLRIGLVDAFV